MKNKLFLSVMLVGILMTNLTLAQPGRGFGKGYIFDKLQLTDEQETKFDDLRNKHQKEMIDLRSELEKTKRNIKELTDEASFSRSDFLAAHKKVQTIKNKIGDSWANHRMDMRDVLTADQKTKLAEMKEDLGDDCRPMHRNFRGKNRHFNRGNHMPW